MDAKWIKILHIADRDTVIITVAHHFILYLLPSLQRFFYQHLWRECKGFLGEFIQLSLIITEATAQSAKSICCTQDDGIAQFLSCLTGGFYVIARLTLDGLNIYLVEFFHKELAVFRIHDSLNGSSQHLNPVFLQYATLIQFNTAVESRLTAKSQQDAIGALFLNDPLYEIGLHRQEVYLISHSL